VDAYDAEDDDGLDDKGAKDDKDEDEDDDPFFVVTITQHNFKGGFLNVAEFPTPEAMAFVGFDSFDHLAADWSTKLDFDELLNNSGRLSKSDSLWRVNAEARESAAAEARDGAVAAVAAKDPAS
nr:hypothetical protein [Tanacetum cinerariifolium]